MATAKQRRTARKNLGKARKSSRSTARRGGARKKRATGAKRSSKRKGWGLFGF